MHLRSILHLFFLTMLPLFFGGCAGIPASAVPQQVRLRHASKVLPAKNPDGHAQPPGGYFQLTYDGLEMIDDGAPAPVCRLPKGTLFKIDRVRVESAGGWLEVFARGQVTAPDRRTFPVEMCLNIAENPNNLQAVRDELAMPNNRFWTAVQP